MPMSEQLEAALGALGVGAAMILVVYLVVSNAWFRKASNDRMPDRDPLPTPVEPVHDYPEGLAEAHGPVPLLIKLMIVGFILWAIGYVVVYFTRFG
jgi:hypothetical protein